MRRRRHSDDGASLDLLLDTITNTLGGVLFLAILLVLLPKASRAKPNHDRERSTEIENLERELAAAETRLESAKVAAEASKSVLASLGDPESIEDWSQARTLRAAIDEIDRTKAELREAIQTVVSETDTLSTERVAAETGIREAEEELAAARENYRTEVARRSVDLPLPRERAPHTPSVGLTLRYGRLYFNRATNPDDDRKANLEDFTSVDASGRYRVVTPKPWKGLVVAAGGSISRLTALAINVWPPDDYHFDIVVWDDSYNEMQLIRTHLASRGQAYRLIPVTDGDSVTEGYVPNARVQ